MKNVEAYVSGIVSNRDIFQADMAGVIIGESHVAVGFQTTVLMSQDGLLNMIYYLLEAHPKGYIPDTVAEIADKDVDFASGFGYSVRNMAVAGISERGVEAWIGPTLVHKDHPFKRVMDKKSINVDVSERGLSNLDPNKLVPPEDIVSAYYFRIKTGDKPMVLARICSELAKEGINICEVRQPGNFREELDPFTGLIRKVGVAGEPVDIAFLLDPCERGRVEKAASAIRDLDVVLSVEALFRVLGNPTQDISRLHSS